MAAFPIGYLQARSPCARGSETGTRSSAAGTSPRVGRQFTHAGPAHAKCAVRADRTDTLKRRTAPGTAKQERRGTDPLMAGINTRCGALAPRPFRSLIHHEETRG